MPSDEGSAITILLAGTVAFAVSGCSVTTGIDFACGAGLDVSTIFLTGVAGGVIDRRVGVSAISVTNVGTGAASGICGESGFSAIGAAVRAAGGLIDRVLGVSAIFVTSVGAGAARRIG